jgi:hypothetical protein
MIAESWNSIEISAKIKASLVFLQWDNIEQMICQTIKLLIYKELLNTRKYYVYLSLLLVYFYYPIRLSVT